MLLFSFVYADSLDGVRSNIGATDINQDINLQQPLYISPLLSSESDVSNFEGYIPLYESDGTSSYQKNTSIQQESKESKKGLLEQIFQNGSYNVQGIAGSVNKNKENSSVYGTNLSAQTGRVAGINVGTVFNIINPFFDGTLYNKGPLSNHYEFLPANREIGFQNLYLAYNANNINTQIGWINLNTPWVTSYGTPFLAVQPAYQGVNFAYTSPKQRISIQGFGFNGFRSTSSLGFTGQTMYNTSIDPGTQTTNITGQNTAGAFGVGARYADVTERVKGSLWLYSFTDYANMLYGASSNKFSLNPEYSLLFNTQASVQWGNGASNNILISSGYATQIGSTMLGFQTGIVHPTFEWMFNYNYVASAFGGNFQHGGLVTPYTNQFVSDPLFTSPIWEGLAEFGAGNAYGASLKLKFFDSKFTIMPRYVYFDTIGNSPGYELDIIPIYNVSKRLSLLSHYTYAYEPPIEGGKAYNVYRILAEYSF